MEKKAVSLKRQFLTRLFFVLLAIMLITGILQIVFLRTQIDNHLMQQSKMLSRSIENGIQATELAVKSIEHQIDLKLLAHAYRIGDMLQGKDWQEISNDVLVQIRDELHLAGITIMAEQGDDIVGVRATDPREIGFSFKKIGYEDGYEVLRQKLAGIEKVNVGGGQKIFSYEEKHALVLPTAQSGSHGDTPKFFKYAYYVAPSTHYIINPYIEANEVYQYTKEVGPQTWIEKMTQENPSILEIAVVNPLVFKDPKLEKRLFPRKQKILYGSSRFLSHRDNELLIQMGERPDERENVSYVDSVNGKKVFKMFWPIDKEQVIYAALDYDKIIQPLYNHSLLLIVSGFAAVIALFLITARFFDTIYRNIQRIKQQILSLEGKDFTAKSDVRDGSELGDLSASANRMVDTLHEVLLNTSDQAEKVQRLSMILESDAKQSVEKMYTVSMETTMKEREIADEMVEFLDQVEERLNAMPGDINQGMLEKVRRMREFTKERAATTTDFTITLSDLVKSLHIQSKVLAEISDDLLRIIHQFKL